MLINSKWCDFESAFRTALNLWSVRSNKKRCSNEGKEELMRKRAMVSASCCAEGSVLNTTVIRYHYDNCLLMHCEVSRLQI